MKKKFFYSFVLFLFSSAFWVANSTASTVANVTTIDSDFGEKPIWMLMEELEESFEMCQ